MKRAAIVLPFLVVAGYLAAAAHSRPDAATATNDGTLAGLHARVDELIDRVARLEHAAGSARRAPNAPAPAAGGWLASS